MSLQMFTVEYAVPVAVDGVTPAPAFSFDPASPAFKEADADGIVRFSADEMLELTGGRLGLIDPDFGVGGTFADRFLHMVEVRTAGTGPAAAIAVVDARDAALAGQEEILPPSAEADFYTKNCVFIPQGSALGLSGFTPTPGAPVVIRINVVVWGSVEDYAHLLQACCCLGSTSGGLEVQDEGTTVVDPTTILNFIGAGVTVTPGAETGEADVTIPGGAGGDIRTARIIVGNAPAGDTAAEADFLDTGNGAGIAAALAAAAAVATNGVDVYIKSGLYDFGAAGAPALPLTIPSGVFVRGGGRTPESLTGTRGGTYLRVTSTSRALFTMATQSSLRDMGVELPAAAAVAVGASLVDATAGGVQIANVDVDALGTTPTADESLDQVFNLGSNCIARNCRVLAPGYSRSVGVLNGFRLGGSLSRLYSCVTEGLDGGFIVPVAGAFFRNVLSGCSALAPATVGFDIGNTGGSYLGCMADLDSTTGTVGFSVAGIRNRLVGCEVAGGGGPAGNTGILLSGVDVSITGGTGVADCTTGISVAGGALRPRVGVVTFSGNTDDVLGTGTLPIPVPLVEDFVWIPGEGTVNGPIFFESWALLIEAILFLPIPSGATQAPTRVQISSAFGAPTIPAGTYAFLNVVLSGRQPPLSTPPLGVGRDTLTTAAGATLVDCTRIVDLDLFNASTVGASNSLTYTGLTGFDWLVLDNAALRTSVATNDPVLLVPPGAFFTLELRNESEVQGAGGSSAAPTVSVPVGLTLEVHMFEGAIVEEDAFFGAGDVTLIVYDDSAIWSEVQPSLSGTLNVIFRTAARDCFSFLANGVTLGTSDQFGNWVAPGLLAVVGAGNGSSKMACKNGHLLGVNVRTSIGVAALTVTLYINGVAVPAAAVTLPTGIGTKVFFDFSTPAAVVLATLFAALDDLSIGFAAAAPTGPLDLEAEVELVYKR